MICTFVDSRNIPAGMSIRDDNLGTDDGKSKTYTYNMEENPMKNITVIERATGNKYTAEQIEGGFQLYTLDGEAYKKLKDSTFKRYFKKAEVDEATETQEEAPKDEENKATEEQPKREPLSAEKYQHMVEKIKKMLALAENNPSQEEALSAALQAHKLMAKYNIHEDEVRLEEIKEDEIDSIFSALKHNSSLHKWRKNLAVIIAKAFRCKAYCCGKDMVFRGFVDDAKLALEVYLALYTIGDRLGSKAYNEALTKEGSGQGIYNSFVTGFLKGVEDAFNEQCTALLVITPKVVEEEWKQFSANFKHEKLQMTITNRAAYNNGYSEGKSAVKARALEKKGGN